jgi:hypothetical protein
LARSLLNGEQAPSRCGLQRPQTMFDRFLKPRTSLDKAIALSFAAMLAMNIFVLSQQLTADPELAIASPVAAQQA